MPYYHLLKTSENLAIFRNTYNIPDDIEVSYCDEGAIEDGRRPHIVFFPLMSILEGDVRFCVDPFILRTLRFYGLSPYQCLPNFYRIMSCVVHLNQIYGLSLTHHDINFIYHIRGGLSLGYYLQTRSTLVWLISCLPDSSKNSVGEFVKVSKNWLNRELSCPTSPHKIGRFPCPTTRHCWLFTSPKITCTLGEH